MGFIGEFLSYLSSHSLFSTIFTLYTLIFLYFPSLFLKFVLSPLIISTTILLLSLLRLGAAQYNYSPDPDPTKPGLSGPSAQQNRDSFDDQDPTKPGSPESSTRTLSPQNRYSYPTKPGSPESSTRTLSPQNRDSFDDQECISSCKLDTYPEPEFHSSCDPDPDPFHQNLFLEWDVRAPLDIIYEEYDGTEAEESENISEETRETQMSIIRRYASLSLFYPESDNDTSSEEDFRTSGCWDLSEDLCFRCEEEDDRDGLIEIALDEKTNFSEEDEENLIEIDLFPAG